VRSKRNTWSVVRQVLKLLLLRNRQTDKETEIKTTDRETCTETHGDGWMEGTNPVSCFDRIM